MEVSTKLKKKKFKPVTFKIKCESALELQAIQFITSNPDKLREILKDLAISIEKEGIKDGFKYTNIDGFKYIHIDPIENLCFYLHRRANEVISKRYKHKKEE